MGGEEEGKEKQRSPSGHRSLRFAPKLTVPYLSLSLSLSYSLLSSQDLAVRRNRERTLGGSSSLSRSLSLAGLGKGTTFLPPSLAAITPTTHVSRQLSVLLPSSVQGDAPLALPSPPHALSPSLPPSVLAVCKGASEERGSDRRQSRSREAGSMAQAATARSAFSSRSALKERERERESERERDAVCVLCQYYVCVCVCGGGGGCMYVCVFQERERELENFILQGL